MKVYKNQDEKTRLRQISLYLRDTKIIDRDLNRYGDFSGFVRFCLRSPKIIKMFLEENQ